MSVKAIAMDVDGVLTDGFVWLDADERETKRISFTDIMGVSIGRRAGLHFALVSGEAGGPLVAIAAKLGITEVYAGCKDKAGAVRDFASNVGLDLDEVGYIGDDVNDVEAMRICGFAAVPAHAHASALAVATFVSDKSGGAGAVREIIDHILSTGGRTA